MKPSVHKKLFVPAFWLVFAAIILAACIFALLTDCNSFKQVVLQQPLSLALAAILISAAAAFALSVAASSIFLRTLNVLARFAKQTAEGLNSEPIEVSYDEVFGGLAGSLNRLSEQLKKHVTTLAEERDRFEAVLNGMNDAILALDHDQRITLINRAAAVLLSLDRDPIGHTLLETVRVPALHDLVVEASSKQGKESTAEFDLDVVPPRKILARATGRKSGTIVVVLIDVTELRRLENIRRDFVSNVSHELRTPVSIMRANAETLLDGAMYDCDAAQKFLSSILTNAERLSNLISDLLDISRIEEGKLELTLEPVSVYQALKRAAEALETNAVAKSFTIKVEPANDLKVLADLRALDQVLFNYTDNAVKYSGKAGKVILRARELNGLVKIEVEDDGPGIEPKHRPRIFERFYRVDPGRSRAMGGTGLGLAIAKHLAVAMGGDVGMTPVSPKGSIFWISLKKA